MIMKFCFIVNPSAYSGKIWRKWPRIAERVRAHFDDVEILVTEFPGHATELAQRMLHEGFEAIVSVGGDGTNHEIINGFFENGVPINPDAAFGLFPIDGNNDLAMSLNLPSEPETVLLGYQNPEFTQGDLMKMSYTGLNGETVQCHVANMASLGLNGLSDQIVNQSSRWLGKRMTYLMGTGRALFAYKPLPMLLTADGKRIHEGKCMFAAIGNGRYYNGGMMITPNAELNDGQLDVVVVGDLNFWEHCTIAPLVYTGKHVEYESIREHKARRFEAIPMYHDDILVSADGEPLGKLPVSIEVVPNAIRYIKPQPQPTPFE